MKDSLWPHCFNCNHAAKYHGYTDGALCEKCSCKGYEREFIEDHPSFTGIVDKSLKQHTKPEGH